MATKYTFNFTDTGKSSFDVQSYTPNGLEKPSAPNLMPNAASANTTLKIYGKGLPNYGEGSFQNMIYMLENFANATHPYESIEGQIWYENVGGELFIRNTTGDGSNLVDDWDAIILATGTSAMTGHLTLTNQPPTADYHAVPLTYLTGAGGHFSDTALHISPPQDEFLDGLTLGSPNLTSVDVNQLIGISGNVQNLLDSKLNLSGGTMTSDANITLTGAGEILGLPDAPSVLNAATSKKYVDDRFAAGDGGDGVLTSTTWVIPVAGSPISVPDITQTSLELTVTYPNLSTDSFEVDGIARVGHTHDASGIALDNTFNLLYPTTMQDGIEYIDLIKANLSNPSFINNIDVFGVITAGSAAITGTITAATPVAASDLTTKQYVDELVGTATPVAGAVPSRQFDILTLDLTSPATYTVQQHLASDDTNSITINGIKQYLSTRGIVNVKYAAINISTVAVTGLDQSLNYEFDIAVDGGAATTITILSGTDTSLHGLLIAAIADEMGGSPPLVDAQFTIIDTLTERFTTTTQGSTSSIVISDPGNADVYLFDIPSVDTIVDATFYNDASIANDGSPPAAGNPDGSPPVARPDTIEISGDVEVDYPVGQPFTIRGSDDAVYGSYDGVYAVHVLGANFNGTNTVIPIAGVSNPTINIPLLPFYTPQAGGSPFGSPVTPVPAPSPFGSTYISPIVGFDQLETVDGLEGDYIETDASGNASIKNTLTSEVVFNYDILNGSKIESLIFS